MRMNLLPALAFVALFPLLSSAATIELDQSTNLLDGSTFTAGTTYIAAFQLTASGIAASQVSLSLFNLSNGAGFAPSSSDVVFGIYTVGPDDTLPAGIWQSNGTLFLLVTPSSASAVYTQAFQAGTTFSFTYDLITDQTSGTPDQFAFQLYDESLSNLLYEVTEDALDVGAVVPEPSSVVLVGAGALLFTAVRRRKRT